MKKVNKPLKWLYIIFFVSIINSQIVDAWASPAKSTPHSNSKLDTAKTNILFISDEIKRQLDEKIRPIRSSSERTVALHAMIFNDHEWGITYAAEQTLTAQETYEQRRGNCISLAMLFVAAARYVGLPAKFQSVTVPEVWTPKENYYVVSSHVNAVVRLPKEAIHVEFLQTIYGMDYEDVKKKRIPDTSVFAEYHNNIAMERLEHKHYNEAEAHLELALNYDSNIDFIWSNFGVLYKFTQRNDLAEEKYKQALKINKKNFSALTNLYILYSSQGRKAEAEKIASKVERYSRKNPYHLAKLANSNYRLERYQEALSLIKKAIKKGDNNATFYHTKAKILYKIGDHPNAMEALKIAQSISKANNNSRHVDLYQRKIESLQLIGQSNKPSRSPGT